MEKTIFALIFSIVSLVATAQTDYDIQLFLDNRNNERPRIDNLSLYLNAGNKLYEEGKYSEADVFYDFAASLGSTEGFRGKALVNSGENQKVYNYLLNNEDKLAKQLLNALSSQNILSSALFIHDHLNLFCLNYLRDPLLDWMPFDKSDTTFLRKNDEITYMIAKLKEDNGNKFDALLLYDIAAWEGNYEALKKSVVMGNATERALKRALIGRMEKEEKYVSLHKYFADEELSFQDYSNINSFTIDPNEKLVSLALGINTYQFDESLQTESQAIQIIVAIINSRDKKQKMKSNEIIDLIRKNGYKSVIKDLLNKMGNLSERQTNLFLDLIEAEKILSNYNNIQYGNYQSNINRLNRFLKENPNTIFSEQAVLHINRYYEKHPAPWSKSVLEIINLLPMDKKIQYTKANNPFYPLYEQNLFSNVHHSKRINNTPIILDL